MINWLLIYGILMGLLLRLLRGIVLFGFSTSCGHGWHSTPQRWSKLREWLTSGSPPSS